MIITLMVATATFATLMTCLFTGRKQVADTLRYGALAPVWREGYLQGVEDERTSAAWDVPGYGPNRGNPYPGDETLARNA